MKRALKHKGITLALALSLAAGVPAMQAFQAPVEAAAKAAKNGLKQENGKYYYYKKGAKVKKTWITIGKKEYYFQSDGSAAIGWTKIGKKIYYFTAKGIKVKNKNVDGVKLNQKGEVSISNERAAMLVKAQSAVAKITKSSQSKAQKLKACYADIRNCEYAGKFVSTDTAGWEVWYASDMLDSRKGNCYSYAAAFGMLARACGFDAKIVTGQISKDGAQAINHAWVEIGGKLYDPQTEKIMSIDLYGKNYADVSRVVYTPEKKI